MRLGRLLLASLIPALFGCHDFAMPAPLPAAQAPLQALGTACSQGTVCESGACSDGVCCERACLEHESCVAPGHLGVCTARGTGESCERGAQCSSGACAAGICCERACEESETCHAPGRIGLCTVRGPGEACERDAVCGSGACADGVCCDRACDSLCETCRNPGAEGRCELAQPYTDPRGDCAGDCSACYLGLCVPVLVGEAGKCAEGQACAADGNCFAARGEACLEGESSSDARCASGLCAAGACAELTIERLEGMPMEADPARAGVVDLAASGASAALLFWEYSVIEGTFSGLRSNDLYFALDIGAGWRVRRLARELDEAGGDLPASVAFLGAVPYVARHAPWDGWDCLHPSGSCGLVGQFFTPAGEPGGFEAIDDMASASWIDLVADGQSALHAVYLAQQWEGESTFHSALSVRVRGRSAWEERIELARDPFLPSGGDVFDSLSGMGQARVAVVGRERGVLVVYATEGNRLRAWWTDEQGAAQTSEVTPPAPDGAAGSCTPSSPLDAARGPDGAVLIGFVCLDPGGTERTVLATFQPDTGGWSWQWRPIEPYAFRLAPLGWRGGVPYFAEVMWAESPSFGWQRASTGLAWTEGSGWRRTSALEAQGDGAIVSFAATAGVHGPLVAAVRKPPANTYEPLELLVARYRW